MSHSVRISDLHGHPILEILNDGEPWGTNARGQRHFRFGVVKARMIRAALPIIEKFVATRGGEPWPKQVQHVKDAIQGNVVQVTITKHEEFEVGEENPVYQPYLELYCGERDADLGIGLRKCQAILDVWPHIEEFLARSNA